MGIWSGDITSPGIELEKGCYFRGEVDMGAGHERPSGGRPASSAPAGENGSPETVADDEYETVGLA